MTAGLYKDIEKAGIGPLEAADNVRANSKLHSEQLIVDLIEEDGCPLIWSRITEQEQESSDATCRKLYWHLNPSQKIAR